MQNFKLRYKILFMFYDKKDAPSKISIFWPSPPQGHLIYLTIPKLIRNPYQPACNKTYSKLFLKKTASWTHGFYYSTYFYTRHIPPFRIHLYHFLTNPIPSKPTTCTCHTHTAPWNLTPINHPIVSKLTLFPIDTVPFTHIKHHSLHHPISSKSTLFTSTPTPFHI